MATRITARDLSGMLSHWIGTPVNGYLGSGYGSDLKSLLQTPMASGLANGLIAKARQDIPLLLTAPADAVNVYSEDLGMDRKGLVFEVAGELVPVGGGMTTAPQETAAPMPVETPRAAIAATSAPTPGYF